MATQRSTAQASRRLSPRAAERQKQERQFERMIRKLASPEDVFEVALTADEKAVTIRQRLLKVASAANVDVAIRRRENGFLVGLMTADRQERRGRRARKADSTTA